MVRLHLENGKSKCRMQALDISQGSCIDCGKKEKEKGEIFIQNFSKLLGSAAEFLGFYV